MIGIIQKVKSARVMIENKIYSRIDQGYLIFVGIYQQDQEQDAQILATKIIKLRIMPDCHDKMNLTLKEVKGEILVVPQFTLCATLAGRRPSFSHAKPSQAAKIIYDYFVKILMQENIHVASGKFGAKMQVELINDGPVTFIVHSKHL
jgi:D-tyrosyl-tRNA(Tyr) deacylase